MSAFDRIIGYESIKEELLQVIDMIRNPDKYLALGAKLPRGMLLYGDPGLGKTVMSEAFIRETGLPVYTIRKNKSKDGMANEIAEMFQKAADNAPCIVFMDDMDKLANEDRHHCDAEEYVMIQAGIDAVKDKGVFILATANNIVKLPDSLLRPGRFDRRIEFDTPTQDETARIIRYYLADKKLDDTVNLDDLSKMVDYESCATMETILNEAAVYAAYAGKDAIGTEDLVRAVLKLEYNGPERHCDILEEKIRRIAIHEAAHAVIAERLAPGSVGMLSIRKGDHAGMMHLCGKEKSPEVTAKICLAGKAAEEMFYPGEVAIGAADDIEKAIRSVLLQLNKQGTYGFGAVDIYPVQYDDSSPFQAFKQESMAQAVLDRYLFKVHSILQVNRGFLTGLRDELLEKGTLLYSDIQRIKATCDKRYTI